MNMTRKTGLCIDCNDGIEKTLAWTNRCLYHYNAYIWKKNLKKITKKKNIEAKKSKEKGQLKMFEEIFDERNRQCFITGVTLQPKEYYVKNNNFHWLFHHVLPKGLYSRFKLFKPNIVLLLPEVHFDVENMAESDLVKKYPGYNKLIELKEQLKQQYNDL